MDSTNHNVHYVQVPLGLWEVVIRRDCKTKDLYNELKPKLNTRQSRVQIMRRLDRSAREQKNFEVRTEEGLWVAIPKGKTETGFYLWKLLFRPSHQTAA